MRPPRAALVLSALLVTAGCLGVLQSQPSDPGAEAVVDEAVAAGEAVETYRVATDLHAAATEDGDRRTVDASSTGVVDRPARRSRMVVEQGDASRAMYVVGNTTYVECASPWSGWGREEHDELDDDWAGQDPLGRQLTLLDESPVAWVGNETRRGVATHVVEARPDDRTLTQFSEERRPLLPLFGPRVEGATVRAWVAEDSGRLLRTRVAFTLRAEGTTVETTMVTTFSDYGASVAVRLPAEATEDPFELGCPGG